MGTDRLPSRGAVSLEQIASVIGASSSELGIDNAATLRSVLVRLDDGQWVDYVTQLIVGRNPATDQADLTLRNLRLVYRPFALEDLSSGSSLSRALMPWYPQGAPEPEWYPTVNVSRWHSMNVWTGGEPCWRVEASRKTPARHTGSLPSGPFFSPEPLFYAETLGGAVGKWLNNTWYREDRISSGETTIIVPDGRAYFSEFTADGDHLEVKVSGAYTGRLYGAFRATDFDGLPMDGVELFEGRRALIAFPRAVRDLSLDLLTDAGEQLDNYFESPHRTSWPSSIYNRRQVAADPFHTRLLAALEQGEGEQVEFKPLVKLDSPDGKLGELLRATVAFANTSGGTIYLGVTDDGEIIGVLREIRRFVPEKHRGDLALARGWYAKRLSHILNQAVTPQVTLVAEWVEHAGDWVLAVTVDRGSSPSYYLHGSGESFVRRGGSNRRATPPDLERLSQARRWPLA